MGNAVTSCHCCENPIGSRLPWIFDPFKIIKRVPLRAAWLGHKYQDDDSDKESDKES